MLQIGCILIIKRPLVFCFLQYRRETMLEICDIHKIYSKGTAQEIVLEKSPFL